MNQQITRCTLCARRTQSCCDKCKKVYYCSKSHQIQDWQNHKQYCQQISKNINNKDGDMAQKQTKFSDNNNEYQKQNGFKIDEIRQAENDYYLKQLNEKVQIINNNIKARNNYRSQAIYYVMKLDYTNSLIYVNKAINLSKKIHNQTNQDIIRIYQKRYQKKTSKFLQLMQIWLDVLIFCKLYYKCGNKKQLIRQTMQQYDIDTVIWNVPQKLKKNLTSQILIKYNQAYKEITQFQALLKSFILVFDAANVDQLLFKFIQKYIELIRSTHQQLTLATAYFDYGNIMMKKKKFQDALKLYEKCKSIRLKYGWGLPLTDVLLNILIVQRQMGCTNSSQQLDAENDSIIYQNLAKTFMQIGQYEQAYKYLFRCYKVRHYNLPMNHEDKTRTELLIIFLYNTLLQKYKKSGVYAVEQVTKKLTKKIEAQLFSFKNFKKYKLNVEVQHLQKLLLNTNQQFFNKISGKQLSQYKDILIKLQNISRQGGIKVLKTSNFFKNLSQQKKRLFIALNPFLQQ